MNILKEFKKIDKPWVLEVITERFDFLPIDSMTEFGIVYGGAIRDALAKIRLVGDLDIVVAAASFNTVVATLDDSVKLARLEEPGMRRIVTAPSKRRKGKMGGGWQPGAVPVSSRPSSWSPNLPIERIVRFLNQEGAEVEVIQAKGGFLDAEESVIEVPKSVDIVCCGLAMDRGGDLYEIVEGAHDQCVERVLRFNETALETADLDRTAKRIEKLEKRGFKSEIDLDDVRKRQEKANKGKPKKKPLSKKEQRFAEMYDTTSTGRFRRPRLKDMPIYAEKKQKKNYDLPPHLHGKTAEEYGKIAHQIREQFHSLSGTRKQLMDAQKHADSPEEAKSLVVGVRKIEQQMYDLRKMKDAIIAAKKHAPSEEGFAPPHAHKAKGDRMMKYYKSPHYEPKRRVVKKAVLVPQFGGNPHEKVVYEEVIEEAEKCSGGGFISVGDSDDFAFEAGDFTVDCHIDAAKTSSAAEVEQLYKEAELKVHYSAHKEIKGFVDEVAVEKKAKYGKPLAKPKKKKRGRKEK